MPSRQRRARTTCTASPRSSAATREACAPTTTPTHNGPRPSADSLAHRTSVFAPRCTSCFGRPSRRLPPAASTMTAQEAVRRSAMIWTMRKEYASLKRRPFLAPVWIFALWAAVGLALAAWWVYAASTTVVVVTRHAEKAADGSADPPLSAAGLDRAARLAGIFGGGGPQLGINAVFVTQWRRTAATARPLAVQLGIPVITVPADDLAALERRIKHEYRGQRVLVIAHNDTVPALVKSLGQVPDVPPLGADEYGTAYVVAIPRWSRPTVLRLSLP
jgi:phosphohistidine phosphatase SixA